MSLMITMKRILHHMDSVIVSYNLLHRGKTISAVNTCRVSTISRKGWYYIKSISVTWNGAKPGGHKMKNSWKELSQMIPLSSPMSLASVRCSTDNIVLLYSEFYNQFSSARHRKTEIVCSIQHNSIQVHGIRLTHEIFYALFITYLTLMHARWTLLKPFLVTSIEATRTYIT